MLDRYMHHFLVVLPKKIIKKLLTPFESLFYIYLKKAFIFKNLEEYHHQVMIEYLYVIKTRARPPQLSYQ